MDLDALFSKLEKHEIELKHLAGSEETDRKNKILALKVIDFEYMQSNDEDYES